MTLDEAVKEAAAKGLTHLTIWPVHSQDRKTVYWYARATPSTAHSFVQAHSTDPVEALVEVLKALPKAPKRSKAEKVTVSVSDAEPTQEEETKVRKKGGLNPEWGI